MEQNTNQQNLQNRSNGQSIPPEYAPISMWGYFGYELLFAIPCVGFILLIVFSFSASNVNLKNFARSYFCFLIIIAIIIGLLMATGMFAAVVSSIAG